MKMNLSITFHSPTIIITTITIIKEFLGKIFKGLFERRFGIISIFLMKRRIFLLQLLKILLAKFLAMQNESIYHISFSNDYNTTIMQGLEITILREFLGKVGKSV